MANDEINETPDRPTPPPDPSFGAPDVNPANLPVTAPKRREPVIAGDRGIQIRSLADLAEFSRMIFDSNLAPKSFKNTQSIALAIQKGMEHGLKPLQALHSVYVVNGMPNWTAKAALGLVRASGLMVPGSYRAWIEGEGDNMVAYCESQRYGERIVRNSFSVKEAKIAKLWGKTGREGADTPWITFPKRMLGWKPISHHLYDVYSDLLGGMPIAEDMIDVEVTHNDSVPRKSLLGAVAGPATEDKLLAAAGVTTAPVTDSAPAAEGTDKTGETDPAPPVDPKADAKTAAARVTFEHFMGLFVEAEDVGELEVAQSKAIKAAGGRKDWEEEAEAKFRAIRTTRFGNVKD